MHLQQFIAPHPSSKNKSCKRTTISPFKHPISNIQNASTGPLIHHPRWLQLPSSALQNRHPSPLLPTPPSLLPSRYPNPPSNGSNRPLQRLPHRHRLHPPNMDLCPCLHDQHFPPSRPTLQSLISQNRIQRRTLASRHDCSSSRRVRRSR